MAPQVTVFFQELKPTEVKAGQARGVDRHVSFTIDQSLYQSDVPKLNCDTRAPITQIMIGSIPVSLVMRSSAAEAPTRTKTRTLESPQQVHRQSTTANTISSLQTVKFSSTSDSSSGRKGKVVKKRHQRNQSVVNKTAFGFSKSKTVQTQVPVGAIQAQKSRGAFQTNTESRPYMVPVVSQKTQAMFDINSDRKLETVSVMATSASSIEDQLEEMKKMLAEKDAQIAALTAQLAVSVNMGDQHNDREKKVEGHTPAMTSLRDIKALIAEGIREAYMSSNSQFSGYSRPYPAHYDAFPFPMGYQKPDFDKFDGINGSLHEHLAHFYSACGETSQSDALLIRQFVQSLKGAAFTWYSQLQPGSMLTWDDIQRAFLAQFVSSKKKVSIIDLNDTKQKSDENTTEFISRWRGLNIQCSEKLSELSAVQMCSNNLLPEIATFISIEEPRTFEALVSKASNVERQLARQKYMGASHGDHRFDYTYESLATFVKNDTKSNTCKGKQGSRKLTLKERKEAKYSFDDEDVEQIFSELIDAQAIELPEPKRHSDVNKTGDPKYCQYHRIVSHPTKDCIILKDVIQMMVDKKEIEVETSSAK